MIKEIRNALADLLIALKREFQNSSTIAERLSKDNIKQSEKQTKSITDKTEDVRKQIELVEKAIKDQKVIEQVSISNPEVITGDLKKGLEDIITTLKEEVKNFDKQVVVKNDLGQLASAFKGSKEKKDLLKGLERIEKAVKDITYPEIPDNTKELLMIADKIGNQDVVAMLTRLDKEVMDVNLDPNLIEKYRVKVALSDDQIDRLAKSFTSSGGIGEDSRQNLSTIASNTNRADGFTIPAYDQQVIDESSAPATTVITYKNGGTTVATKTITVSGTTTTITVT